MIAKKLEMNIPVLRAGSLLETEDLVGKVQMIYLDPPYGITANFYQAIGGDAL